MPSLIFPFPELTVIVGKPTIATLQTFKREVYANARAIHSTGGGGLNGHLALVMDDAAYALRAGQAFNAPAHPGEPAAIIGGMTSAQIEEGKRVHKLAIEAFLTYNQVKDAIKAQLLAALDPIYINVLADVMFGFADVTPQAIMAHVLTTYGTLTADDLEANRKRLEEPYNPDDPIEVLWTKTLAIQQISPATITDATVMTLTLNVLEKTGVFQDSVKMWRMKEEVDKTLPNFHAFFNKEDIERRRRLSASTAGYHGANGANSTPPTRPPPSTSGTPPHIVSNGTQMYYCYTHGLGMQASHTSATCTNKCEGHQDAATATNMMGGNNRIMVNGNRGNNGPRNGRGGRRNNRDAAANAAAAPAVPPGAGAASAPAQPGAGE